MVRSPFGLPETGTSGSLRMAFGSTPTAKA